MGLTKDHAGPAAARNHAIEHARGRWLVFYDDDARVEPDTIPGHLAAIRAEPDAAIAHLGRVDWPDELLDAPWSRLLAESSMLFFWDRMVDRQTYGFRHFWTTNLSVPRELVHLAGGFDEGFPTAIHEDIELGWRLQERFGLRVRVHQGIRCLHDHGLSVNDYFAREHKSGRSALAARTINPPRSTMRCGRGSVTPQAGCRRCMICSCQPPAVCSSSCRDWNPHRHAR